MNTQHSQRQQRPSPTPVPQVEQDFDQLAEAAKIEHLTIPGFMRRVSNRWHIEDITRFGDKVGRAAEALQLSYMTTVDRSLGIIRVFPVPLLQRIYTVLSVQFGWPQIIEAEVPAIEDNRRAQQETIRSHERFQKHLRLLLEASEEEDVQHSAAVLLQWLEQDCQRLRQELEKAVTSGA
ncbi:MAG: hypothetical protein QOE70_5304 [Chthoniobacter sp.]|nr:hypothetical protein [Chthoniobacter sp.]